MKFWVHHKKKRKMTISNWIKKNKLTIIGGVIGAVGGYLYWQFVGCSSGTCPITSSPLNSSLYGILIGALLGSSIKDAKKQKKGKEIDSTSTK